MQEKRKSQRYKLNMRSYCIVKGDADQKPCNFSIQDISKTGFLFLGQAHLPAGCVIELFLKISDKKEIPFTAKIVRCEQMFGAGLYETGATFIDMTQVQKECLNKILAKEVMD